jgi:hypothetical protein
MSGIILYPSSRGDLAASHGLHVGYRKFAVGVHQRFLGEILACQLQRASKFGPLALCSLLASVGRRLATMTSLCKRQLYIHVSKYRLRIGN